MLSSLYNQTPANIPSQKVNETEPVNPNQNLSIRFNITNIGGTISSVWIKLWETTKSAGNTLWEGLMSLTGGLWTAEVPINESYPSHTNYTVYVNDTANRTTETEGNFSVNQKPAISSTLLNATSASNLTTDNLTAHPSGTTDPDNDAVTINYNWYIDGVSDTTLNMPFTAPDKNNKTYDLSGNQNHGTIQGAEWNRTGGYDGAGAYELDGSDDYVMGDFAKSTVNYTASAWINPDVLSGIHGVVGFTLSDGTRVDVYQMDNDVRIFFPNDAGDGSNYWVTSAGPIDTSGEWYHIVGVYDGDTPKVYVNGVEYDVSSSGSVGTYEANKFWIGRIAPSGDYNFDGSIDQVRIYNRTLSEAEINLLYANKTNTTHSSATNAGENWTVKATPIDEYGLNGTEAWSNSLIIENSQPQQVTLIHPANGNTTVFDRTPLFNWTESSDPDGDSITYTINITHATCPDIIEGGITDTNFTPSSDLCLDSLYNWTITPSDGTVNGTASDKWNFTVASSLIISLPNDNSSFGSVSINEDYNTSYEGAPANPLKVRNDGNTEADVVEIGANESLWSAVGLGTSFFQFKANNRTTESGAFDWATSITTWTDMPDVDVANETVISSLNYSDSKDDAEVDIRVKVPADEPMGSKTSTVIITGAMSG